MRNATSRINTAFFITKIKNLLTVCGVMELLETINHAPKGDMSMIPQKQLTLADIFEDCQEIYESDKPQFLTLLENHIDLDEIVPVSFRNHYYASTGRNRKYQLNAMLWALIIQRLFSIPTDSLLLVFLHYSRHLREFCGFTKVPDASKITRFKQDFLPDLQSVFDNLVDITEPICHDIDENLASMPTSAAANHEVKQQYINGHFCYAYKFGILTNGLGIVRSIDFYNRDYLDSHPDIVVEKKSKSPDEDKSLADSKALLPTLKDFKKRHPDIEPNVFLGDAAFDTIEIYKSLFEDFSFKKAFIPLKTKLSMDNVKYTFIYFHHRIGAWHEFYFVFNQDCERAKRVSQLPKIKYFFLYNYNKTLFIFQLLLFIIANIITQFLAYNIAI